MKDDRWEITKRNDYIEACHYVNGVLHNNRGPAVIVIYDHGKDIYQAWCIGGRLSRLNGPARIWSDGSEEWYQDDVLHRINGPARTSQWGGHTWWYNGELLLCNSQEEFEQLLRLKAFW
jgi:hypothetical protein